MSFIDFDNVRPGRRVSLPDFNFDMVTGPAMPAKLVMGPSTAKEIPQMSALNSLPIDEAAKLQAKVDGLIHDCALRLQPKRASQRALAEIEQGGPDNDFRRFARAIFYAGAQYGLQMAREIEANYEQGGDK